MKKQIHSVSGSLGFILLFATIAPAVSAFAAEGNSGSKRVIDLGQLEIEGELRRPPVNWIGNMKGLKDLLPSLYASEFKRLEEQLLRPAAGTQALPQQQRTGREEQRVSN